MRNPSLLLLIVVFILAPFKLSAAADTVVVRETRIPVLIAAEISCSCLFRALAKSSILYR